MSQKILIVDDEKQIRNILSQLLRDEGYATETAENGEKALTLADSFCPDLILMDQKMPGMDGIEAMSRIRRNLPDVTVIILTAHASVELAVEAIKRGAYDYLPKPFDNDELLITIRRALEHNRLTGEITNLREQLRDKYSFSNIIGESPGMKRVFEQITRVCSTTATVLIQGESGTGKELIAKAIHHCSSRKDKPFVSVNCGAIPVSLIESELFGHERGAFTDARERRAGKFEQAQGGTFLLDEVGELPLEAQVKLLRVLDERKVTCLGGKQEIEIDTRLIAATNKNLEQEVKKGEFRLDLLYRLNIFTIAVPPLRERREDIPLLVEHFIGKYNKQLGLAIKSISAVGMKYMQSYDWPGNVRDLQNAVQRAMIQCGGEKIDVEDLPMRVCGYSESVGGPEEEQELCLDEHVSRYTAIVEKEIILKTLREFDQNRSQAAGKLGISRKTLYNKMKIYGLL